MNVATGPIPHDRPRTEGPFQMSSESQPTAAYVHVPFCAHRCGYCDFTLVARRDDLIDDYLRGVELELASLGERRPVETLFLGGGTPTHLPPDALQQLMTLLHERFELAAGGEFSIEANPAGLSPEKIAVLADAGVNRVSLGAQSFAPDVLTVLERDHSPDEIVRAVETVQTRIDNVAIDLIFGVPGQTIACWEETLQSAIALGVQHVSTYGLTIEKGTAFWSRRRVGTLVPVPDDVERAMYALAMDRLPEAGFAQYEISNFACPGFRCRHNETYWRADSYYAFGPGAARYIDGRRETNHRSVTTWLKRVLAGESPVADTETLSPEDRAREMAILGLRMTAGLSLSEFETQTGFTLRDLGGEAFERYLDDGLLEIVEGRLRLTREGRFLADSMVVDFL